MKKLMVVLSAMMFLMVMAGGAYADNPASDTVVVNAKVIKTCVNPVAGLLQNMTIDPNGGTQTFSKTTDATIDCTKNLTTSTITAIGTNGPASAVSCNDANWLTGFKVKTGSNTISYSFECAKTVTGAGIGTPVSLGIAAEVLSADAAAADYAAGATYTDTVTLTIAY